MTEAVIDLQDAVQAPPPSFAGGSHVASVILERARQRAAAEQLPYAGSIAPRDAWTLFGNGDAVLVDVRSAEERKFVGHVPESKHVAWMTGLSLSRNPRFTKELESKAGKDDVVLLLCRSGKRSAAAAEAATKAGFATSSTFSKVSRATSTSSSVAAPSTAGVHAGLRGFRTKSHFRRNQHVKVFRRQTRNRSAARR
jgi:rhodanese-related sulfurtransferase